LVGKEVGTVDLKFHADFKSVEKVLKNVPQKVLAKM
jgi:hypothetical protein